MEQFGRESPAILFEAQSERPGRSRKRVCHGKGPLFARVGDPAYRLEVIDTIGVIVNGGIYHGRALALGRELAAYVIAADLIDLKTFDPGLDSDFRATIRELLTTPTIDGPANLI